MGHLDKAVDISDLGQRQLWVVYGRSGSGKTEFLSTFPKPMLYIQIGDDGSNTIANKEGIKALRAKTPSVLKEMLIELQKDRTYASVVVDTFSLFVEEWTDENAVKKKKKMTQQMWGDLRTDSMELIKLAHILAENKVVGLSCHESTDTIDGHEDEIAPDIRPSVSKGARTYLEGMANYGIHLAVVLKEKDDGEGGTIEVPVFTAHLAANPYYWVKTQKPKEVRLPKSVINPTYNKIMKLMRGERANGKKTQG